MTPQQQIANAMKVVKERYDQRYVTFVGEKVRSDFAILLAKLEYKDSRKTVQKEEMMISIETEQSLKTSFVERGVFYERWKRALPKRRVMIVYPNELSFIEQIHRVNAEVDTY